MWNSLKPNDSFAVPRTFAHFSDANATCVARVYVVAAEKLIVFDLKKAFELVGPNFYLTGADAIVTRTHVPKDAVRGTVSTACRKKTNKKNVSDARPLTPDVDLAPVEVARASHRLVGRRGNRRDHQRLR